MMISLRASHSSVLPALDNHKTPRMTSLLAAHWLVLLLLFVPGISCRANPGSFGTLLEYLDKVKSPNGTDMFTVGEGDSQQRTCEEITSPICRSNQNYNLTSMPNMFGHANQGEASAYLYHYMPLLRENCYPFMTQLICSIFLPICVPGHHLPIPPCRSFCEDARQGCEPLLLRNSLSWNDVMHCDRFPESNPENNVCLMPLPPRHGTVTNLPTPPPTQSPELMAKTSNICPKGERRASIVFGRTFSSRSLLLRKKKEPEKLDGLKKRVAMTSKDKYVISTLDGPSDFSRPKVVKLVSLCIRVRGVRKVMTTFTANQRIVARNVIRVDSAHLSQWSNVCLCDNLALYVDQIVIQLKSLQERVGMVRNIEALVCERSFSIMDLN